MTAATVRSPETLHTAVYQALVELPQAESERAPVGQVWNVPAHSVQFTDRTELLTELRRSLLAGGATVTHPCTAWVASARPRWPSSTPTATGTTTTVWWVPSEEPPLIPERLAGLAGALDLADERDAIPSAVSRLLGTLRDRKRWLLIYDNAEDP